MKSKKAKVKRKGSALLIVLFIVMAITILSLGFLSRSDVELACGENMILRTQMDYLAESELEHARGLILYDSNCLGDWAVAGRQLVDGSNDYYDVSVVKDVNGECNYRITCDAYRGSDKMSSLQAELRLDPYIAFWSQTGTTVPSGVIIYGDVYCNGTLTNYGTIGDVFASGGIINNGSISGQSYANGIKQIDVNWPNLNSNDFSSQYSVPYITDGNSLENPSVGVLYCPNDIKLSGDVNIVGMLIVAGNLTITESGNVIITAGEDLPAMLVTGDLIIEDGSQLAINGLAVVNGIVQIGGTTNIAGGLFVGNGITDTGGSMTITAAPSKTAITTWPSPGNPTPWSPVGGAFFKSIERP